MPRFSPLSINHRGAREKAGSMRMVPFQTVSQCGEILIIPFVVVVSCDDKNLVRSAAEQSDCAMFDFRFPGG